EEMIANERKQLEFQSDDGKLVFILARVKDIPQYIDKNWADVGIAAFDCYREYELESANSKNGLSGDNFLSDLLPDLKLCDNSRFCICGYPKKKAFYEKCKVDDEKILEVATSNPQIASKYFNRKGMSVDIITVSGSSELMPKHGDVDVIFDIVETGSALEKNGLVIFEEAMPIKTKFLVSKAALKYDENIGKLVDILQNSIEQD
ncbi:MAG: ATP phosphoribosyltransferase, partial [Lachnospiraceae bacterium]|nr:ATP phosphoribosyltransferase [Lachnospiraceae bacterium]